MLFSTFRLPVSGINLGNSDTDAIIGTVTPTLMDTSAVFLRVTDMSRPYGVFTYNLEGTIATYVDETGIIQIEDFLVSPFGTVATMDVGDALFIRPFLNTVPTAYTRVYFRVSTPGVGTYSIAVRRYNATTETWDLQTITADTTSNFTVAGIGYIEFTSNVHDSTRLQQQDGAKQFWTKFEIATLTAITTAPVIDAIWFATSGTGVNLFIPSEPGITISFSATFINANTYYVVVADTASVGWNVLSKIADDIPVVFKWEYYNSSGVWTALTPVRDETNGLSTAVTNAEVRWPIPADWSSMTLSWTSDTTGNIITRTGFLHRLIPANPNIAVLQTTEDASIALVQLGASHSAGLPLNPGTIDYLTYDIRGATSTTPVTFGIANATSGKMSTVTIAVNRASSFADSGRKLNITDLAFANDDEFMLFHLAGGNLSDFELRLHTA